MATYACTIAGVAAEIGAHVRITAPANGHATLSCEMAVDTPSELPAIDDAIVVTEDATTIFSGQITAVRSSGIAGHPTIAMSVAITATDNHARATRRYVIGESVTAGQTLKQALQVIVDYIPGVTLSGSQADGPTLATSVSMSAWTAAQALEYLTTETGWLWRIDNSAVLSMYEPGTWSAPFDVIDGDGHTDGDVESEPQRTDFATKVIVIAANGIIGTATDASYATNPWEFVAESADTTDQTSADALAAAILAASLVAVHEVQYSTLQAGVLPGMTQTITLADRGLNNTFLVTEVNIELIGSIALRRVRATEGVVYKTGWREKTRSLFGGAGGAMSLPGVGAVVTSTRFFYFLGGTGAEYVQDPTPTWVDASPMTVQIDTVPRGTLSAQVTVQLRALEAGVTVKARLYDVTAAAACSGESTVVISTSWTTVTFTATLTAGSHLYRLQVLPGSANADVGAIGYLV